MKHFLRQNGLLLLIIALLLSVLIGIVSAVMGGNADPLSNAVGFITTPIRNGVSAVLDWADGVRAYVFHYEEMEQQIQDLERQVAELEEQAREGQEASCWICRPSGGTSSLSPPRSPPAPPPTGTPLSPSARGAARVWRSMTA